MASLGQDLKRERELRGIPLREIADSTRISLRLLQALEEDHLEILPGKFFVRAILRSYAKSIGLDENQWLNKYQEMLSPDEYQLEKETRTKLNPPRVSIRKRMLLLGLILAAVVLAALLCYVFISSPETSTMPPPKANPQVLSPVLPPKPVEAPAQEPVAKEARDLNLIISCLEETWIQLYADGKIVWDGLKARGEVLQVKAERDFVFNVGNAGGLTFTINGKKAKPLGPLGAVRKDIRITLDNYRDYILPEEKDKD